MLPASEDLEAYHEHLQDLDGRLARYKGAEVKATDLVDALAEAAKRWVRLSTGLRAADAVDHSTLEAFDTDMRDVLQMAGRRARASAYQKKLRPLIDGFVERVIIPVIRHEGSPAQVAGRQLRAAFTAPLTADETAYIEEASRCVGVRCYRAAVIMLWGAAVARMHQGVQGVGFAAFNAAYAAAGAKKGRPYSGVQKGAVTSLPELQRLREFDLLVTGMDLWGYDMQAFEELERLLGIRNTAAHPGMVQPSVLDVQQFAAKVNALVFATVRL